MDVYWEQFKTPYLCYADIVISSDIVQLLRDTEGDVVVVGDRNWRNRLVDWSTRLIHRRILVPIF